MKILQKVVAMAVVASAMGSGLHAVTEREADADGNRAEQLLEVRADYERRLQEYSRASIRHTLWAFSKAALAAAGAFLIIGMPAIMAGAPDATPTRLAVGAAAVMIIRAFRNRPVKPVPPIELSA